MKVYKQQILSKGWRLHKVFVSCMYSVTECEVDKALVMSTVNKLLKMLVSITNTVCMLT